MEDAAPQIDKPIVVHRRTADWIAIALELLPLASVPVFQWSQSWGLLVGCLAGLGWWKVRGFDALLIRLGVLAPAALALLIFGIALPLFHLLACLCADEPIGHYWTFVDVVAWTAIVYALATTIGSAYLVARASMREVQQR